MAAAKQKRKQEDAQPWQLANPVSLTPDIDDKSQQQAVLITARQGDGLPVAAGQLGHAIASRATHLMLDYSQTACAVRYQIDGQWEAMTPLAREFADPMLIALKQICQLNPADRRSAQSGRCEAKLNKDKYRLTLQSQGTAGGERVLIRLEAEAIPFSKLSELGMRDTMIEHFREALNSENSTVLIGAPRGMGLSTTWHIALNTADRLVRDFQSLEPEDNQEPEIINVSPNYYGGSGPAPAELIRKMILKEPDVFVLPGIPDEESLLAALNQAANNDKQVIARVPAASAVESCVKLCAQYPQAAKHFASTVKAVLNQRIVRRLCDDCKQSFQPSPALLKKLGIPAGRVSALYQQFVMPPIEQQVDAKGRPAPIEPCQTCQARGFLGRVGIFELLRPGPQFRAALLKTQDVSQLTKIAQTEGFRGLQAEAILAVARGLTSIEEIRRVFAATK